MEKSKIILEDHISEKGSYCIRYTSSDCITVIGLFPESPIDKHYLIQSKFYISTGHLTGPTPVVGICHKREEVPEKLYECALRCAIYPNSRDINDGSVEFINNTKRAAIEKLRKTGDL